MDWRLAAPRKKIWPELAELAIFKPNCLRALVKPSVTAIENVALEAV